MADPPEPKAYACECCGKTVVNGSKHTLGANYVMHACNGWIRGGR